MLTGAKQAAAVVVVAAAAQQRLHVARPGAAVGAPRRAELDELSPAGVLPSCKDMFQ